MSKESSSNVANISDFSVRDFNLAVTASSLAYESHRTAKIDQGKFNAEQKLLEVLNNYNPMERTIPFFKGNDTEPAGYAIYTGSEVIISFRGTDNLDRAASDLDARKTKEGHHKGFDDAYRYLKGSLDEAIAKIHKECPHSKEANCTFTGHSYGGAMAQIAAKDFATRKDNLKIKLQKMKVITFGAPRVFSRAAAVAYNKILGNNTVHFQNKNDLVPGLPKKSMDFEHTGLKVRFISDESGHSNDNVYKNAISSVDDIKDITFKQSKSLEISDANKLKRYRSISSSFFRYVAKKINNAKSNSEINIFSLRTSLSLRESLSDNNTKKRSSSIDVELKPVNKSLKRSYSI